MQLVVSVVVQFGLNGMNCRDMLSNTNVTSEALI